MIISLRPSRAASIRPPATPQGDRHGEAPALSHFQRRLARLSTAASFAVRGCLLLLALIALGWNVPPATWPAALYLAAALSALALGAGLAWRLPLALALLSDGLAAGLLILGSGGAGSPLLGLPLLLVVQGALLGSARDALVGSGVGALVLLSGCAVSRPAPGLLAAMLAVQLIGGATVYRIREQVRLALRALYAGTIARAHDHGREAAGRVDWRRLAAQVNACATIDALVRLAREQAGAIGGALAVVELADAGAGSLPEHDGCAGTARIPISCGAVLGRIELPAGDLPPARRSGLEQLAALVGLRALALRHDAQLRRQQAALTALWETAGLLRIAPDPREACQEACRRLAGVLDLDWLALLAPDELHALAPFVFARGRPGATPPHLSGAQLRVAAEALRGDRPLVRAEGRASLVCLPVGAGADMPVVLAALGRPADIATQTLLMLLGGLIADRLRVVDCRL